MPFFVRVLELAGTYNALKAIYVDELAPRCHQRTYTATRKVFVNPLPALVLSIRTTRRDNDQSVSHIVKSLYAFTRSRDRLRLINKRRLIEGPDFLERFLDSAPEGILPPRRQYRVFEQIALEDAHPPSNSSNLQHVSEMSLDAVQTYSRSAPLSYLFRIARYALHENQKSQFERDGIERNEVATVNDVRQQINRLTQRNLAIRLG